MILNFAIFLGTLIAMEGVGFLAHKYVMHGWGWFLHRSHHEEHLGAFETNDIYLLALGLVAVGLIVLGNSGHDPLQWVGAGGCGLRADLHPGSRRRGSSALAGSPKTAQSLPQAPLSCPPDAPRGERPTQQRVVRFSLCAFGADSEKTAARHA
jgi:hypothetical protein